MTPYIISIILMSFIGSFYLGIKKPELFNSTYQLLFMLRGIYLREVKPAENYKLGLANFLWDYFWEMHRIRKKHKIEKKNNWDDYYFMLVAYNTIEYNSSFNESTNNDVAAMLASIHRDNIYFIRYFFEQENFDFKLFERMRNEYESGAYRYLDYHSIAIADPATTEPPVTQINANENNSLPTNQIEENEEAIQEDIKGKEDPKQIANPIDQNNQPLEEIIDKECTNDDDSVSANKVTENEKAIPEDIKSNLELFRTAGWLDADYQPIENLIIDKNGIPLDDQNKNQKGQEYNKNTYTLTKNMYAAIGYAVCIGYKSPKNQKPKYATIMSKIWHNTTPDQIKSNYNYYKNTYRELPMSDAKGFERLLSKILREDIDFSTKEEK